MKKPIRILMVEDNRDDAELIQFALPKNGFAFEVQRVETEREYVRALKLRPPDLILSDHALPGFDGFTALRLAREGCPSVPFIFVTGTMGEELAIETLKQGARDYVLKHRLGRLAPAVQGALREAAEREERNHALEQLRQSHEQLRALSVHLQHVREEERIRISRIVHDELGQDLTSLKLDLAWLGSHLPHHLEPLVLRTRQMAAHVDETIRTVQRVATELRPGILDHLGLAAAIEWQANEFQTRTGIGCRLVHSVDETILDEELNTAVFRIFQEALTNVARHAGATQVEVELHQKHGRLTLEIRDNGRGITPDQMTRVSSIGLLGMRERAALLDGTVEISARRGQGTRVLVSIPHRPAPHAGKSQHEHSYRRRSRSSTAWVETNPRR
jgi:signal transduction histidine kinase